MTLSTFLKKIFKRNNGYIVKNTTKVISIYETIEIMGHKLNYKQICDTVECSVPLALLYVDNKGVTRVVGKLYITEEEPSLKIQGLHTLNIWEPYPCFDEHDYDNESRFHNYYILSKRKFNEKYIIEIMNALKPFNLNNIPAKFRPLVYRNGENENMTIVL